MRQSSGRQPDTAGCSATTQERPVRPRRPVVADPSVVRRKGGTAARAQARGGWAARAVSGVSIACAAAAVFILVLAAVGPCLAADSVVLGEEVVLDGTNSVTDTTFLFVTGPNIPAHGGRLESPRTGVIDGDPESFTRTGVDAGGRWQYRWQTRGIGLDTGVYVVYASAWPRSRPNLVQGDYTSQTYSIGRSRTTIGPAPAATVATTTPPTIPRDATATTAPATATPPATQANGFALAAPVATACAAAILRGALRVATRHPAPAVRDRARRASCRRRRAGAGDPGRYRREGACCQGGAGVLPRRSRDPQGDHHSRMTGDPLARLNELLTTYTDIQHNPDIDRYRSILPGTTGACIFRGCTEPIAWEDARGGNFLCEGHSLIVKRWICEARRGLVGGRRSAVFSRS